MWQCSYYLFSWEVRNMKMKCIWNSISVFNQLLIALRALQDGVRTGWDWSWHTYPCRHASSKCWNKLGENAVKWFLRLAFPSSELLWLWGMASLICSYKNIFFCCFSACLIVPFVSQCLWKESHSCVSNCLFLCFSFIYPVSVQLYSPKRSVVDIAEVFLWLMAVGTILCASYWSASSAREALNEHERLLKASFLWYFVVQ